MCCAAGILEANQAWKRPFEQVPHLLTLAAYIQISTPTSSKEGTIRDMAGGSEVAIAHLCD